MYKLKINEKISFKILLFYYIMASATNNMPLIDRYRPKNISSVILPIQIELKFKKSIGRKNISDTLIAGQNGVGKTLLLNIVSKSILREKYHLASFELNTTVHRCLKDLNSALPPFCDQYVPDFNGKKLVLIDKVDNLTKKAQNLVANLMDDYRSSVAFLMTCDDQRNVSSAIISKCDFIYIPQIESSKIMERLESICMREEIYHTDEALQLIADSCDGDIRSAINLLDNINNGFTVINVPNTKMLLYRPSSSDIKKFVQLCIDGETYLAIEHIQHLKQRGFCGTDILLSIINIIKIIKIDEHIKIGFTSILVKYYIRMSEEIDTDLQLYVCVAMLVLFANPTK
jgi:DNA polymerase III delta prime subunit